jgi:transcriptional regulator with XRE-family HTH domain
MKDFENINFKQCREHNGYSKSDVAKIVGLTPTAIRKQESGEIDLFYDNYVKLIKLYTGISIPKRDELNLKERREKLNITQQEVEIYTGLDRVVVSSIENNSRKNSMFKSIMKIVNLYDTLELTTKLINSISFSFNNKIFFYDKYGNKIKEINKYFLELNEINSRLFLKCVIKNSKNIEKFYIGKDKNCIKFNEEEFRYITGLNIL